MTETFGLFTKSRPSSTKLAITGISSSCVKRMPTMSRTKYFAGKPGIHNWFAAPITDRRSSPFTLLATTAPFSIRKSSGKVTLAPSDAVNVTALHFMIGYAPAI